MSENFDLQLALDTGGRLAEPTVVDISQVATDVALAAVVPEGHRLLVQPLGLDHLLPYPRRKTGTIEVRDVKGFLTYWDKHRTPEAEVYADINLKNRSSITAVFNSHASDGAGWGDHRLTLLLEHTPGWARWIGKNGSWMTQIEFAEHIEESLPEIREPSAADMLELAQTFQAATKADFKSGTRLSSGETRLVFEETIAAKAGENGQIEIPNIFTIVLQPWKAAATAIPMTARLRYRINNGQLVLGYQLDQVEESLERVTADLIDSELAAALKAPTADLDDQVEVTVPIINGRAPSALTERR